MTTPTTYPSVEEITCVVIRCAACGNVATDDLETPAHWPSLDEAHTWLSNGVGEYGACCGVGEYGACWEVSENRATWVCPRCILTRECDRDGGHEWTSWRIYGDRAVRYCKRCEGPEERPVIVPKGIAL